MAREMRDWCFGERCCFFWGTERRDWVAVNIGGEYFFRRESSGVRVGVVEDIFVVDVHKLLNGV